jgi:hypothetical protein
MANALVAGKLLFLDPTVAPSRETVTMAPRIESLEGKVVGLLDNSKMSGRIILDDVGAILTSRYGVREIINAGKPTFGRVAAQALVDDLVARCDVVITAIGD